ncbi:hypothetical protein BDY17DRAFT_94471 [Neohortaea acidophila]|uniref:Uncharacterized protein n=1 Tax=Neohortaea acidophila TaxID=245834 RepID=A0A6A6PXS8_9PEZI|nr:uncharacterized protein BDY17DRAFT_94471 [Neohortaea acidophila]KAF2484978.1 hypothetical protein BDY17DRAFT_94471 [Neohortaea acidophila]
MHARNGTLVRRWRCCIKAMQTWVALWWDASCTSYAPSMRVWVLPRHRGEMAGISWVKPQLVDLSSQEIAVRSVMRCSAAYAAENNPQRESRSTSQCVFPLCPSVMVADSHDCWRHAARPKRTTPEVLACNRSGRGADQSAHVHSDGNWKCTD